MKVLRLGGERTKRQHDDNDRDPGASRRQTNPHGDPATTKTLNNVGNTYLEQGRFDKAATCYEDAPVIFRETATGAARPRPSATSALPTRDYGSLTRQPYAGGTRRRQCVMPVTTRKLRAWSSRLRTPGPGGAAGGAAAD